MTMFAASKRRVQSTHQALLFALPYSFVRLVRFSLLQRLLKTALLFAVYLTIIFSPLLAQPKKKITAKMLQLQGVSVSKLETLSSPFFEGNLSLSPNGRFLYFATERGGQTWSQFDERLNRNDRDIWVAERKDGIWQRPKPLPEPVNSGFGEDEPNITPDGQNVIFQSFRSGWEGNGGPYFGAELKGTKWDNIAGLGGTLTNFFVSQQRENDGAIATDGSSMSPAGNLFIFTCGKDLTPKSPHDLYIAKRFIDGSFSQVERLEISTPKNERTVFIGADGKTLYFASNGYGGLGGLDIFKTTLNDDGTFGTLYNLGEPFNSKGDDYGFILSADGKEAYFIRDGDIYIADLSTVESRELKAAPMVLLTGLVKSKATGNPLESSIDISEVPATGMEELPAGTGYSLNARSNAITGEFGAILRPGKKYMLSASASKHKGTNKEFTLTTDNTPNGTFTLDIELDPVPPRPPKTKVVTTATVAAKGAVAITPKIGIVYFSTDDFTIEEKYLDELDKVWEFLKANPSYQAEISGFADDRGSYEYNLRLSQRRVNAVIDYLWSLGCERKRLALKFFGEEEPIANNLTEDGRSRNRRAEITFFRKAEDTPLPSVPSPVKPSSTKPGTAAPPPPTQQQKGLPNQPLGTPPLPTIIKNDSKNDTTKSSVKSRPPKN